MDDLNLRNVSRCKFIIVIASFDGNVLCRVIQKVDLISCF